MLHVSNIKNKKLWIITQILLQHIHQQTHSYTHTHIHTYICTFTQRIEKKATHATVFLKVLAEIENFLISLEGHVHIWKVLVLGGREWGSLFMAVG